ncbi:MAG: NUDIX domain-containing protein [Clostridia bacterium]|nr:NUDIX domain-containing protein [Clostridia bacterium]
MKYVKVCGAVVFTKKDNEILYVIVKSKKGVWGFPKGHNEPNESEEQTAIREIKEETNLDVKIIKGFRVTGEYKVPDEKDTIKNLVLFIAEYKNQSITFQKEELQDAKLMNFNEATNSFKYENLKKFLKKADEFIKKLKQ